MQPDRVPGRVGRVEGDPILARGLVDASLDPEDLLRAVLALTAGSVGPATASTPTAPASTTGVAGARAALHRAVERLARP